MELHLRWLCLLLPPFWPGVDELIYVVNIMPRMMFKHHASEYSASNAPGHHLVWYIHIILLKGSRLGMTCFSWMTNKSPSLPQTTPASSEWSQIVLPQPRKAQSNKLDSEPLKTVKKSLTRWETCFLCCYFIYEGPNPAISLWMTFSGSDKLNGYQD